MANLLGRDALRDLHETFERFMSFLGVLFVVVVLGETIIPKGSAWSPIFVISGWVIWALFALEFMARLVLAPSKADFMKKNWWQGLFLLFPFLRFLRLARFGRAGRLVSSAVRGSRSAGQQLRSRLAWLAAVTVIVILSSAQLIFEFGDFTTFGDALHVAAISAITGAQWGASNLPGKLLEVALAIYSVGVFAGVAGSIAAYLLPRTEETNRLARWPREQGGVGGQG